MGGIAEDHSVNSEPMLHTSTADLEHSSTLVLSFVWKLISQKKRQYLHPEKPQNVNVNSGILGVPNKTLINTILECHLSRLM